MWTLRARMPMFIVAYRCTGRALTMIDIPGGAYVVDLFSVAGGETHDYLFHGPPVDMTLDGVSLSGPRKGTFAGEDIAFGEKPDDVLPYHVDNKGYQYLYDVRTGTFNGALRRDMEFRGRCRVPGPVHSL